MKWRQDQAYLALIQDLMEAPEVKSLSNFVHHKVTTRLDHSLTVSYLSYRWALRLGLNARAIARAGLLHDLFFYEGHDKHTVGGRGHNWEHPRIALENARKLTEISDLEADIIVKHMFGATLAPPRYLESLVVSLMDKQAAIMEVSGGLSHYIRLYYLQRRAKLLSIFI